jgi:hypothetical protein
VPFAPGAEESVGVGAGWAVENWDATLAQNQCEIELLEFVLRRLMNGGDDRLARLLG